MSEGILSQVLINPLSCSLTLSLSLLSAYLDPTLRASIKQRDLHSTGIYFSLSLSAISNIKDYFILSRSLSKLFTRVD